MIVCEDLTKRFRNYEMEPGVLGALKSFVHRRYREVVAVDNFSLSIHAGEFVGLLGPNGAGKTTLMKMFTGVVAPSEGRLEVLGYEPFDRLIDFRKRISLVMGQKSQLWWDIPARTSFELLRRYYEVESKAFEKRLHHLSELLEVRHLLNIHVRKLSLGERMKMELMASLLHEPEVIFLDEPTIGLDLVAQRNIRSFLREYQKETGTTVVLTSHYMADVHELCERVVLILQGQKRFDGSIENFVHLLGTDKFVSVEFRDPVNVEDPIWSPLQPRWNTDHTEVKLLVSEDDIRQTVSQILQSYPVVDFHTGKIPIEHVMETLLSRPELVPPSVSSSKGA
ncbi:MAG: ATP-binding cassette domain-containing protein [Bdellovibrionales bacterium]|nr:ATP-binding cassette domain-containing protein [Bdellovibrionales bacterium]